MIITLYIKIDSVKYLREVIQIIYHYNELVDYHTYKCIT